MQMPLVHLKRVIPFKMSVPTSLHLDLRFPRLIIAGYGSVIEARLEAAGGEDLRNITLELRSEAFENGVVERQVETLSASFLILPLAVRAQSAGIFPLEVRLTAGTPRGQLTAQGHFSTSLTVLEKPESLQSLSVTIGTKAFQGALFNEVNEAIKIGEIRDINQLIGHVFPAAPWEPVQLTWSGFPVVRGLKSGFIFAKRFELIRPLGQGGMGVVWLAADSALKGRHVALKFLPQEVCHDPGAIDDLRDEVLKARDLSHENIVRIYDLIEADGTAAISMEYIDGLTLDAHRRTLPGKIFEVADVLRILPALCSALDYAHKCGLIHHDIKPLNLMLTQDGVLKVCDFGLAGSLCETKSKLSGRQEYSTSGTTPYMSPQHLLLGTRTVADDIYSLGATLYELLTGKPPFYIGDLTHQIERTVPSSVTERRQLLERADSKAVPTELNSFIQQCLAKEAARRPSLASILQLGTLLEQRLTREQAQVEEAVQQENAQSELEKNKDTEKRPQQSWQTRMQQRAQPAAAQKEKKSETFDPLPFIWGAVAVAGVIVLATLIVLVTELFLASPWSKKTEHGKAVPIASASGTPQLSISPTVLVPKPPAKTVSVPPPTLDRSGDPKEKDLALPQRLGASELARQLGPPNFRHGASICALACSPDGKTAVTGGKDMQLRLWDLETGLEIRIFSGHSSYVSTCAFSPGGTRLLSGSWDCTLKLWEVSTGKEIRSFSGHSDIVTSSAFSPDGTQVLSGSWDNTLKLWDAETGKEMLSFSGYSGDVTACAFSRDGTQILSGSAGNTLKLWNTRTGQNIRSFFGHSARVTCCAFVGSNNQVLSGSWDNTLKLWDVNTGTEIRSFSGHTGSVTACDYSRDGRHLLSSSEDKTLKLWNKHTGEEILSFSGHTAKVTACAFSPDGTLVLSCSGNILKLWDASTGKEILSFSGHSDSITACEFSPNSLQVVSSSWDNTLKLWNLSGGKEIISFSGHSNYVNTCAFSPGGNLVLSGSRDSTLKLWDVNTGKEIQNFSGHSNAVTACAFGSDSSQVISGSWDNTLKLWDINTGKEIRSFSGHSSRVTACAFSPDGPQVLSGSDDNTLKLWNLSTGKEIRSFSGHSNAVTACVFRSDGNQVLSSSDDDTLKLWNANTGKEIRTFTGHSHDVVTCAFSPDGTQVLSGSKDHTLRLWNAVTGECLRTWDIGHSVNSILIKALAPNTWPERPHSVQTLAVAVGLSDGTILLLDLTDAMVAAKATVKETAQPGITPVPAQK